MVKKKTKTAKVPRDLWEQTKSMSDKLKIPVSKGFSIRDNILLGNYDVKKKKTKRGTVFEFKFKDY